ncbi:MAG TPA: hypothetical protein RMH85_07690 [Polyangiaceae bacterium LLY-WYZ-15_(1-7)]|nr:hypothetical protein [Myxococcales bacterium]MAT28316.1 hypothetical protein [Sandaracinus sp.]HJK95056.1 hypothetical protein [Polyangiaceae bacterium LLY-WYZ-15_(1-7)]MBJ73008.1 hypothetical protein [Sandaracinus sp.]HJL05711.1 hypothetical protein [Polyangiaceae bacterium LLY-WYZ-15_(1-7)]
MDRSKLEAWLAGPRRTWRWNRGDPGAYTAVEATATSLRWYRWSHEMEDGGAHGEVLQTHAAFVEIGPPATMEDAPKGVVRQLLAWIEEHGG